MATIRFSFAPSTDDTVREYQFQWREVGGEYQDGPRIDADLRDGLGRVFSFVYGVVLGQQYQLRVRAYSIEKNAYSSWVGVDALEFVLEFGSGEVQIAGDEEHAVAYLDTVTNNGIPLYVEVPFTDTGGGLEPDGQVHFLSDRDVTAAGYRYIAFAPGENAPIESWNSVYTIQGETWDESGVEYTLTLNLGGPFGLEDEYEPFTVFLLTVSP